MHFSETRMHFSDLKIIPKHFPDLKILSGTIHQNKMKVFLHDDIPNGFARGE